jgi:hypothetical protein
MSARRTFAILKKQIKDTLKNKTILLQFVMFPLLTVIMANNIELTSMPENFFVILFGTMYIGMAPLISMSSIISEEKEYNTLRVLLMSNVKAAEYLIGISSYVIFLCTLGTIVIGLQANYNHTELAFFTITMVIGIIISTLIGAVVGVYSKNQMTATSISVPFMVVFSFMPMLAFFNEKISKISKYIYSQQINDWISNLSNLKITNESMIILAVNFLIAMILFILFYRKKGLES